MSLLLLATAGLAITAQQDPPIVQCEFKFMKVGADYLASPEFLMGDAESESKVYLDVAASDDENLAALIKAKRAKIVSAPVIRTMSGLVANITVSSNEKGATFSRSIDITPKIQADGTVKVDMNVEEKFGGPIQSDFLMHASPTMKLGRSTYWLRDDDPSDLEQTLMILRVTTESTKN